MGPARESTHCGLLEWVQLQIRKEISPRPHSRVLGLAVDGLVG